MFGHDHYVPILKWKMGEYQALVRKAMLELASAKLAVLRTMRTAVAQRGWRNLSDDDEEDR